MSFYNDSFDDVLRQGDVVRGLPLLRAKLIGRDALESDRHQYSLDVKRGPLCTVLTPCCSLDDRRLLVAELVKLRAEFYKHELFRENPLLINEKLTPVDAVGPGMWETLSTSEQVRRLGEGTAYVYFNVFIFDRHADFDTYQLRGDEVGYYMVDFGSACCVHWDVIKRVKDDATLPETAGLKLLQLSPEARDQLRRKLVYFYSRVPQEDQGALLVP